MVERSDKLIDFLSGERKIITVTGISKDPNETVIFNSAEYELVSCGSSKTVDGGECELVGGKAELLLEIDEKGVYTLTVTAKIGREIIKKEATVRVR